MKKGKLTIVLILVVLIVAGIVVGALILLKKNKPNEVSVDTQTLYVETYDAKTEEKIKANFIIVVNKTIVAEGTTNLKGLEEITIPVIENQNIHILGFSDDYYVQMSVCIGNPCSVDLYKKGVVELINVDVDEEKINLTIKAKMGQVRQLGFAIGWSYSFFKVWNNDYLEGEYMDTKEKCENYGLTWTKINETYSNCTLEYINVFPSRLKDSVDISYYTLHTLAEDENMTITLSYSITPTVQEIGKDDNLEIIFYDSDRNAKNKYGVEDMEGNDIGGKDYRFVLNSECLKGGECNLEGCSSDNCLL